MNDDDFNKIFFGGGDSNNQTNFNSARTDREIILLKKSNKLLKIWSIVLSAILLVSIIVFTTLMVQNSRSNTQIEVTNFDDMTQVVSSNTRKSVVQILSATSKDTSAGSGFIVKTSSLGNSSYIMTNKHVISNSITENSAGGFTIKGNIYVIFFDNVEVKATLVDIDATYDLAILRVDGLALGLYSPISFESSKSLQYGDFVVAIGNSLGLGITTTQGVISLPLTTLTDNGIVVPVIQTDAAINPGNSGGPLINKNSKIVGIVTYKKTDIVDENGKTITVEGMGYAIPSDNVISFINNSSKLDFDL